MKIAFIAFDNLTTLDLVGIYDPLTRLKTMGFIPDLTWHLCALNSPVKDDRGLTLTPDTVGASLEGYNLVVAPGGYGTRNLCTNAAFLSWIGTAQKVPLKASVCTGSLLFGAAGFLRGLKATTHPSAYELLTPYCKEVRHDRIVDEGAVVTAGGVTSALDLGLYLVARLAGAEARQRIKAQMDYPYGD